MPFNSQVKKKWTRVMISLLILRLHMKQKRETSLRVCCKHINYLRLACPCISQSLLMKTRGWGKMSGFKPVSSHSLSALSPFQNTMTTFRMQFISGVTVNVLNVQWQYFPFCFHCFTISIRGRCGTPVHMVHD